MTLVACGGATVEAGDTTPLPDAEGGEAAVVVVPFVVDLVALVPPAADLAILARVDLLRGSRVAPLLEELIRSEGDLRELRALGVDPLQDIDRVLVAGRERGNEPDVLAIEHRWSEAQLLDVYARAFRVAPGTPPQLQVAGRFRVVTMPGAEASLLLLSPTVAAFVPPPMVPTILERAEAPGSDASETGRRLRTLEARAPDLAPGAVVRISAESGDGRPDWAREIGQFGLPAPAWFGAVLALDDGASAYAFGGYPSELEAEGAARSLRSLLTQSLNPATLLLRVMGLSRALEASQVTNEGAEVTFRTHLQPDELDRVLERLRQGGP